MVSPDGFSRKEKQVAVTRGDESEDEKKMPKVPNIKNRESEM